MTRGLTEERRTMALGQDRKVCQPERSAPSGADFEASS